MWKICIHSPNIENLEPFSTFTILIQIWNKIKFAIAIGDNVWEYGFSTDTFWSKNSKAESLLCGWFSSIFYIKQKRIQNFLYFQN